MIKKKNKKTPYLETKPIVQTSPVHISKNQHFLFHLIQSYYILFLLFWG